MRRSRKPIVIGARKSRLARTQAQMVGKALARLHPHLKVEYHWIDTKGDKTPGILAGLGGKGLFTRGIERALLTNHADLAVHSLKDLPTAQTPGLTLAAVPVRGEFRDCLIARDGERDPQRLPYGASVGTSSPRRAAQILRLRPDLHINPVRGNVETRLNTLGIGDSTEDENEVDAVMLAGAGLRRLGYDDHARAVIDPQTILPAACQGTIAIQCRANDHLTLTRTLPLNDATTSTAVHAERSVVAGLGATCGSPVAVLARPVPSESANRYDPPRFTLQARVLSIDGQQCLEAYEAGSTRDLHPMICRMVESLQAQGAAAILAQA